MDALGRALDALALEVPQLPAPAVEAMEEGATEALQASAWDPEDGEDARMQEALLELSEPTAEYSGERIRVLLLEVLRRAAYDWVLYRSSRRMDQRTIAHDAYVWLFEEDEYHPWRELREEEGTQLLSFETICEVMDFDMERVRGYVRKLTPDKIKTAGRPPERRKRQTEDSSYYSEHGVTVDYALPAEEEA